MTDMMSLDRFELNVSLNMPRPFRKYPSDMSKTIGMMLCNEVRKTI